MVADYSREFASVDFGYLAREIAKIKQLIPEVDVCVVRGGAVLDTILGLQFDDIDIFYNLKQFDGSCQCQRIKKLVLENGIFSDFHGNVDFENSQEKQPGRDPITQTVGFFSYHTENISMLCIDQHGRLWSNPEAVRDIRSKVYEMRFEGLVMWRSFPKVKDSETLYGLLCRNIGRAISYMDKRSLVPGENTINFFREWRFILDQLLAAEDFSTEAAYVRGKLAGIDLDAFVKQYGQALGLDSEFAVAMQLVLAG
jgi:hypothetical protein